MTRYICKQCDKENPCVLEIEENAEWPCACPFQYFDGDPDCEVDDAEWEELEESEYFEMRGIGRTKTKGTEMKKYVICDNCKNNDETCSLCDDCKNGSMFEKKSLGDQSTDCACDDCKYERFVQDRLHHERPAATPEPEPTGNGKYVLFETLKDICARAEVGQKKYGTMLRTNNGRDSLNDALQEAIDLVMYLKQAAMEREE